MTRLNNGSTKLRCTCPWCNNPVIIDLEPIISTSNITKCPNIKCQHRICLLLTVTRGYDSPSEYTIYTLGSAPE